MMIQSKRKNRLLRLAKHLAEAWPHGASNAEALESHLPLNREEAYFVQNMLADFLGEPTTGWKAGATSARMREIDGHDDIIPGRIFAPNTWRGADVRIKAALPRNARVEAEFAFRLTEAIPLRANPWTPGELANAAILHPAIEIIGDRLSTPGLSKSSRSLATIADNGGGFGLVLGDPVSDWRNLDFLTHRISLRVGSGAPAPNISPEDRCEAKTALADLVNLLSKRGISLDEGSLVSTGAATVPQPIGPRCSVTAEFGEIGTIRMEFS